MYNTVGDWNKVTIYIKYSIFNYFLLSFGVDGYSMPTIEAQNIPVNTPVLAWSLPFTPTPVISPVTFPELDHEKAEGDPRNSIVKRPRETIKRSPITPWPQQPHPGMWSRVSFGTQMLTGMAQWRTNTWIVRRVFVHEIDHIQLWCLYYGQNKCFVK